MQMICALLIFQTADLPAPVSELSLWLDWLIRPEAEVYGRLAVQQHRRFIKTHTPLDGLPIDGRVTYIVVARHPLDMAVSLYFQGANLDRARLSNLIAPGEPVRAERVARPLHDWLVSWIEDDVEPQEELDSLPGVMWHYCDAWVRRKEVNVVLVHYDDLSGDLGGEMRRLARRLGIAVPADRWAELVKAATFEEMRARPDQTVPTPSGILKDPKAFFRRGTSGAGREVLSKDELRRYDARTAELAPPELLAWLHREGRRDI